MNQPLYIIGIDGGGTKTTAVLCALDGIILSEAQGDPSNFQVIGIEKSANTILDLIEACCHSAGCNLSQIGAVVAGLAGAGRTNDQHNMLEGLLAIAQARKLILNKIAIESDARIALEGAFSGKPGVVVISGTGSIVYGKDEHDKIFRAGGWGRLIGDEGSGYSIGREAFSAVVKSLDGYWIKTKLLKLFNQKYGFGNQEAIIDALYKCDFNIASVAPMVMDAATKGDKVAKEILAKACSDLIELIDTVLVKMNKGTKSMTKRKLALIGSLLTNDNFYSRKLRLTIRRNLPLISIHEAESAPVVGAAFIAKKLLDI